MLQRIGADGLCACEGCWEDAEADQCVLQRIGAGGLVVPGGCLGRCARRLFGPEGCLGRCARRLWISEPEGCLGQCARRLFGSVCPKAVWVGAPEGCLGWGARRLCPKGRCSEGWEVCRRQACPWGRRWWPRGAERWGG